MDLAATLSFTVNGTGGLSQPATAFASAPFWWVDTTGAVPGSTLATYSFVPIVPAPGSTLTTAEFFPRGSELLSSLFHLDDQQALTVTVTVVTRHATPFEDVGFALLLRDSTPPAILLNVRPDNINHYGDLGAVPGSLYAPPAPGVSAVASRGAFVPVTMGSATYGQASDLGDCQSSGQCFTDVTSSYVPGAGSYRLLFGAFGKAPFNKPMAIAIKGITAS